MLQISSSPQMEVCSVWTDSMERMLSALTIGRDHANPIADPTFLLGLSPGFISFLANCSRLPLISSKTLLLNGNRR
jgi:hypothetical protein